MAQLRFFQPTQEIVQQCRPWVDRADGPPITNRNGQPLSDVRRYIGRKIKWARRQGRRILVMLEGEHGKAGYSLLFSTPDVYEQCVTRTFVPTRAAAPASCREQHDEQAPF